MTDRKLQQVALESFNYRHEAEFAAGFLRDAGIPFRLQIDDPALGLSAVNSATIWVAAMDERRARQVLDHDFAPLDDGDESWADEPGPDEAPIDEGGADDPSSETNGRRDAASHPDASAHQVAKPRRGAPPRGDSTAPAGSSPRAIASKTKSDLTLRHRAVAVIIASGIAGTLAFDVVGGGWSREVVAVAAAGFALVAILGRAPGPLKGILEALSGDAP